MIIVIILLTLFWNDQSDSIYHFNKNSSTDDWIIVDDVVMGGRSEGKFNITDEGFGEFSGKVSLENNGGFSSIRHRSSSISTEDYTTVVLNLKGDGKDYQFRVKSNRGDYYSYVFTFSTTGEWQEIVIQLKEMYPSFRGRKLSIPNYDQGSIEETAFLIANYKEESFKLLIKSITLK